MCPYLILEREPSGLVPAPTVRIAGVTAGSAAKKAGLAPGDWLVSYDGRRIDSAEDLREAIRAAAEAGRTRVVVTVLRGVEEVEIEMAAGRMGVSIEQR